VGATPDSQGNSKQPYIVTDDDHMEAAMGQFVGAIEGEVADGAQHLGVVLDAMIEAGVKADGVSKKRMGKCDDNGGSGRWRAYSIAM
jgi:hypothetical protein